MPKHLHYVVSWREKDGSITSKRRERPANAAALAELHSRQKSMIAEVRDGRHTFVKPLIVGKKVTMVPAPNGKAVADIMDELRSSR